MNPDIALAVKLIVLRAYFPTPRYFTSSCDANDWVQLVQALVGRVARSTPFTVETPEVPVHPKPLYFTFTLAGTVPTARSGGENFRNPVTAQCRVPVAVPGLAA